MKKLLKNGFYAVVLISLLFLQSCVENNYKDDGWGYNSEQGISVGHHVLVDELLKFGGPSRIHRDRASEVMIRFF